MSPSVAVDEIEIDLLLDGMRQRYGYNFANYTRSSLVRRLTHIRDQEGYVHFSQLLDRVLHDEACFDRVLKSLSITVTEMFRDPSFYIALREKIVPVLKTFPFVKIWHAGCATGEEVYSMAILLHEENFLNRVTLYGTDFNKYALDTAQEGVYASENMALHAANYHAAGGREDFSSYYNDGYGLTKVKDFLKERITFSYHNLVTDGVFGEMNLICCRNVMIYFDKTLKDRALTLFNNSLRHGGYLCLGSQETLDFTAIRQDFEPVDARQRIYKKQGISHA